MPKRKTTKLKHFKYFPFTVKILLISAFFLSLPGIPVYQAPDFHSVPAAFSDLPDPAFYPENVNNLPFPAISAQGIVVLDLDSGMILYQKNAALKFPPASTTKIMTALVSLEKYQPEEILEVKTVVTEGRLMGLVPGEKISAINLIYGALVHSGNDAAYTLAENYPGGVAAFVDRMNEKASEYGLKDTHFTNPIGFEDVNHFTTASDLAQLSRIALMDTQIRRITGTKIISVSDKDYSLFHVLENVNSLLGKIPGVSGVKTGWTQEAKEVLATLVKRNDHEVLIVLLKSDDRFGETVAVINWVFATFKWLDLNPTPAIPR